MWRLVCRDGDVSLRLDEAVALRLRRKSVDEVPGVLRPSP